MARDLEGYLRSDVKSTPFCPGCGHGILMNTILRAMMNSICPWTNALRLRHRVRRLDTSPIFNADTLHTLHGGPSPLPQAQRCSIRSQVVVISGDGISPPSEEPSHSCGATGHGYDRDLRQQHDLWP